MWDVHRHAVCEDVIHTVGGRGGGWTGLVPVGQQHFRRHESEVITMDSRQQLQSHHLTPGMGRHKARAQSRTTLIQQWGC